VTRRKPIRRAGRPGGRGVFGSSAVGSATLLLALAAGLLTAGGATAEPPAIAGKRAEAARVLTQIHALDSRVERAVEAYNLANIQLDRIKTDQRKNRFLLGIARSNYGRAEKLLEERLVTLYTSGGGSGSTLEIVLGARSLRDLMNQLDTAEQVSAQDTKVLGQVRHFRAQMQRRKAQLARAHARQAKVVAERAARKAEIQRQLVVRQQLLSQIKGEIARLEAAERRRQAELRRQAEARLAAQRAARRVAAAAPAAPVVEPTSAPAPEAAGTAPAAQYGGVVGIAMRYLGVAYVWGGASPSGFDCSGLVMYVFAQVGVSLPHNAAAQYGSGYPVSRSQLQPGDLVFFDGLGHVGIYIGGGQFIHAPHTGDVVKISSLSDSWYSSTYVGARRITG
jgi:peptidoglycan DL-endopeptidase CwlO